MLTNVFSVGCFEVFPLLPAFKDVKALRLYRSWEALTAGWLRIEGSPFAAVRSVARPWVSAVTAAPLVREPTPLRQGCGSLPGQGQPQERPGDMRISGMASCSLRPHPPPASPRKPGAGLRVAEGPAGSSAGLGFRAAARVWSVPIPMSRPVRPPRREILVPATTATSRPPCWLAPGRRGGGGIEGVGAVLGADSPEVTEPCLWHACRHHHVLRADGRGQDLHHDGDHRELQAPRDPAPGSAAGKWGAGGSGSGVGAHRSPPPPPLPQVLPAQASCGGPRAGPTGCTWGRGQG